MSLEASSWPPTLAARTLIDRLRRPENPWELARTALGRVCGPCATETVLHTALTQDQSPSVFVDPFRGAGCHSAAEARLVRLAPALLRAGMLLSGLAVLVLPYLGVRAPVSLFMAVAYALASYACFRVAHAVRASRALHTAWLCFGVSAVVSVARHVLESDTLWTSDAPHRAFTQVPIVAALLILIAGLLAMSGFFRQAGLGFRAAPLDLFLLAFLVVAVPVTFALRDTLPDMDSPHALIRVFQALSPFLLAGAAIPAVLLNRVSLQLEGGWLAGVLRLLVGSVYLRLALLLAGRFVDSAQPSFELQLTRSLFSLAAWLFALAAFQQWKLLIRQPE